jgi:hypothetical protein
MPFWLSQFVYTFSYFTVLVFQGSPFVDAVFRDSHDLSVFSQNNYYDETLAWLPIRSVDGSKTL